MKLDPFISKPLRWMLGALMLAVAFHGVARANDRVETSYALKGTDTEPAASGRARYRVEPDQTQLEIEIEGLTHTAAVQFIVDGVNLGGTSVSFGQAVIELESESAAVPVVTANSQIIVADAASGTPVAVSANVVLPGGEGEAEGSHEGEAEGSHEGEAEGSDEGEVEGSDEGEAEGSDEGEAEGQGGDDAGEIELEFPLIATANDPGATGQAELKNDNERRRIEVEVHGVTAAARISVLVDGVNVGTSAVNEGEAKVRRDERANYTIPAVTADSRVDVISSESGAILLSNKDVVIGGEGEGEGEGEGASEGEGEGEGEGQPADGITLSLRVGPNNTYVPGEVTTVEAKLTYTGADPITALSVEQTLPAGWTFAADVNSLGAFLTPLVGDSGTITWAWIVAPAFPAVLRYQVQVPADATGVQTLGGNVVFRRLAGAEYAVATLDVPTGQGVAKSFAHTTDTNQSWTIELSEVLRMIQFYNSDGFHCADGTEDGYAPGPGTEDCGGHDGDQLEPDWKIELPELMRTIQIYNSEYRAYTVEAGTEDGFSPGPFALQN